MKMLPWPLALALIIAGCNANNEDAAGAETLLERVQTASYRSWTRAPGHEQRTPGTGPHGGAIDVFVNPTIADAVKAAKPLNEWPVGSLVVKEGFKGSDIDLIAIMEKRADGWFFAEYGPEGDIKASGRPDLCTSCHAAGTDATRSFSLPKLARNGRVAFLFAP